MKSFTIALARSLCCALVLAACSRSNNVLLGRVEAQVGGHTVVVTDCYRTSVSAPETIADPAGGEPTHRFVPCRDAAVTIRGEELVVNGQPYGKLAASDMVTVDHGKVLINDHEAKIVAQAASPAR